MTEFTVKIPTWAMIIFIVVYALSIGLEIYSRYLEEKIKKLKKK